MEVFLVATCFKMLFWAGYRSTDFAVHSHWLAITKTLPSTSWYFETNSRWTLDYPPMFAWFEYILSQFFTTPEILKDIEEDPNCWKQQEVNNNTFKNCYSNHTILLHRLSVGISELILLGFAVNYFCSTWPETTTSELSSSKQKIYLTCFLIAFDPNLLILDFIHFQYNGYLMGILILSIGLFRDNKDVLGAVIFSFLLCSKHIFLYALPLIFIYLLTHYCFAVNFKQFLIQLIKLGSSVLIVFIISLLSVCGDNNDIFSGTVENMFFCVKQIGSRLFPVNERGLLHAYWAPNFWALYAGMDKILKFVLIKLGYLSFESYEYGISSTQGLVQGEIEFDVLPRIPNVVTFILSFLGMIPALYVVYKCRQPQILIQAYSCCVMSSIFFGYHVHEKALLMVSLPLALSSLDSAFDARTYLLLTWTTQVALAPLLFPLELSSFKFLLLSSHILISFSLLKNFHLKTRIERRIQKPNFFKFFDYFYLFGLFFVFIIYEYGNFVMENIFKNTVFKRYPFLPLMLVSMYCAFGVGKSWIELYGLLFRKQKAIEANGDSPFIGPFSLKKKH